MSDTARATPFDHARHLARLNAKARRLLGFEFADLLFLAPMLNVTTPAYQVVCARRGAAYSVVPMIFTDHLVHQAEVVLARWDAGHLPRPVGVQLIGDDPALVQLACEVLESVACDIIDYNMACPARRELKRGVGGALLEHPARTRTLLAALAKHSPRPFSVKIRAGFRDPASRAFAKFRAVLRDSAAAMVTVHGRTVTQQYAGRADWTPIRVITTENPTKIVVGNGDVRDAASTRAMFETTGCDAIMIGRAAIGHPQVFESTSARLRSPDPSQAAPPDPSQAAPPADSPYEVPASPLPRATLGDSVAAYREFLTLTLAGGNRKHARLAALKTQLQGFLKYFPHARQLRREASCLQDLPALHAFLDRLAETPEVVKKLPRG